MLIKTRIRPDGILEMAFEIDITQFHNKPHEVEAIILETFQKSIREVING